MSKDHTNYYVDVDGTTYRVALHANGRPLIVSRRSYGGRGGDYDIGLPLVLNGAKARKAIKAALAQRAAAQRAQADGE